MQHGATCAHEPGDAVTTLYAIFLLVDWIGAILAFLLEPEERLELTLLVALAALCLPAGDVRRSGARVHFAAAHGGLVGWGKSTEKATVSASARI